jgi:hypothetical protein
MNVGNVVSNAYPFFFSFITCRAAAGNPIHVIGN